MECMGLISLLNYDGVGKTQFLCNVTLLPHEQKGSSRSHLCYFEMFWKFPPNFLFELAVVSL